MTTKNDTDKNREEAEREIHVVITTKRKKKEMRINQCMFAAATVASVCLTLSRCEIAFCLMHRFLIGHMLNMVFRKMCFECWSHLCEWCCVSRHDNVTSSVERISWIFFFLLLLRILLEIYLLKINCGDGTKKVSRNESFYGDLLIDLSICAI